MKYILQYGPIAAAVVFLLLSVFLFVTLLKLRKSNRELKANLELQKSRVSARKDKIYELRGVIRSLSERIQEDEKQLLNSFSPDEMKENYGRIADALKQLIRTADMSSLALSQRTALKAAASQVASLVRGAFHEEEEIVLEAVSAGEDTQNKSGKGMHRVLLVDDNDDSRRNTVEVIESCGFLVEQASNGAGAIEKFRRSREGYYDIIFMDIIMPGKDGYETTREIRKIVRTDSERIPIIGLTANSFSQDYVQLLDAGMNDRIEKPFSRDSFLSIVNKWLHTGEEKTGTIEEHSEWSSIQTGHHDPS